MKRSQKRNRHYVCSEPLEQIENFKAAEAENFAGWCLHHRLEIQPDGTRMSVQELKDKDLYFHRPASELVFMRREEHISLHRKGRTFSEEHRQKIAEAHKGENNPFFGKHHSEETRQKMSKTRKCMLWWNNGISSKRSRECPGEGWTRGRFK